jgi:MFS family permease
VQRLGRRRVLVAGTVTMLSGTLLTLSSTLVLVVVGLLMLTAGFFAAHATASAWVGARATTGRAQATALYNVAYYGGSALVGWLLGYTWSGPGWVGVVAVVGGLALAALAIALAVLPSAERSTARAVTPTPTVEPVHAVRHDRRSGGGTP